MGVSAVLITAFALVAASAWQDHILSGRASREADKLVSADLDHIAAGVYNLVKSQDEAIRQQVDYDILTAQYTLKTMGGLNTTNKSVTWRAVNQFTYSEQAIRLPKMRVGNTWLGQNHDMQSPTPLVDALKGMTGATVTLFQRLNAQGDILRMATNVQGKDGNRAIGTYIPAQNPDGTPNPVVASLLRGETYHGNAFVVNAWYVSAYQPVRDARGQVLGALYVGVK